MKRLGRFSRVVPVLFVGLVLAPGKTAAAGDLPPGVDGCVYFSGFTDGYNGDIPQCQQGGGGC